MIDSPVRRDVLRAVVLTSMWRSAVTEDVGLAVCSRMLGPDLVRPQLVLASVFMSKRLLDRFDRGEELEPDVYLEQLTEALEASPGDRHRERRHLLRLVRL